MTESVLNVGENTSTFWPHSVIKLKIDLKGKVAMVVLQFG